ncbi:hypothetical protein BTM25_24270 [Actinomadura rubteroloni]|uniref:Histidine kinase/HSP90-like ATPase domain-containing protein n=1 Tax=Actinomadura rubteroloni TaxID=1926885 RepID=A0A2P4UFI3_9ACTN|nr:ATP-binding protein [Actinomadura rubteroloni]POM23801.1 hypothetical protein BTM25_24270 [Actinomadura rubteroloni]
MNAEPPDCLTAATGPGRHRATDTRRQMQADVTLLAFQHAADLARQFTRDVVRQFGMVGLVRDAELVVSEIVTNVIKAAGLTTATPSENITVRHMFKLCLFTDDDSLIIAVWDALPGYPVRQTPGLDAEAGRGLLLVDALSDEWGSAPYNNHSKVVWAVLSDVGTDPAPTCQDC